MVKRKKIYFVWHWFKKTSHDLKGAFAVFDSLMFAIQELSKIYNVKVLALSNINQGELFIKEHGIKYVFFKSIEEILDYSLKEKPEVIFLNHHSSNYQSFLNKINSLKSLKIIYYSSPIKLNLKDTILYWKTNGLFARNINKEHKKIDYHLVHHEYQKNELMEFDIPEDKIIVAPKTADLNVFKPLNIDKKWDCIYPGRCTEGYWKRPELAIEACRIAGKSLVMPGANLKRTYNHVKIFNKWLTPFELNIIYNQSRCLLITSNYKEMGPRVIPEAAACNIPIVCCSDSPANVS